MTSCWFAMLLWSGTVFAQGNNPSLLLTTITNPTPVAFDNFGQSVASLGNDRVLVGANGADKAYLFSVAGTLLTTFTNPAPTYGEFGDSVTAVGNDRVLVGAGGYRNGDGIAYLFGTNGTLQTSFINPNPARVQAFGFAVAAVGDDHVVISGLANVNQPAPYPGTAFLFRTDGTLITGFTNPVPADDGGYGISLAALGNDRVLVGAAYDDRGALNSGAAYLFGTNGALLATITNPVPATSDNFGSSVAIVGSDRLLISAIDYGGVKGTGGAAYLFSTNGTLVATFANPSPASYDYFGWSVAAVGSSRVLIGAYQDGTGALQAGSAYLFNTNGTLLNTFTNPTPAVQDWFGNAVAAAGPDHVIIGGVWDNTGAMDAGSVYVYALPDPPLSIAREDTAVSVSWVSAETGLVLQQSDSLAAPAIWNDTTSSVSINGQTNVVQQTIANGITNRFYRLRRP